MHYRSAVLVVIVVSLTLGAPPLQAQITFVSPGAAASKAIREAAARQEDQRRQEESERIARERLALEERRVPRGPGHSAAHSMETRPPV